MKYQIIVLDNIYESIADPIVERMLHKLFYTKKKGYSSRQGQNFLAVGLEDMVCNQIIIAKEVSGELRPVAIAKVVLNTICDRYKIQHPMLAALKGFCSEEYYAFLEKKLNDIHKSGDITAYSGGFTMDRDILEGSEEVELLKEIYCGVHVLIQQDRGVHTMFGYASPKLRTDKLFAKWGITSIQQNGKSPLVKPDVFNNESYFPMAVKFDEYTPYARTMADKYLNLWNNRIDTKLVDEIIEEAA
jgi:hypothetical protein